MLSGGIEIWHFQRRCRFGPSPFDQIVKPQGDGKETAMTTTTSPQPSDHEAQLRQLLVAQKGLRSARELDGLLDRYAAAALVGRPGARSPGQAEPRRGRWT